MACSGVGLGMNKKPERHYGYKKKIDRRKTCSDRLPLLF